MGIHRSTYKWSGPGRYHYFYHCWGKHIPREGTAALSNGLVLTAMNQFQPVYRDWPLPKAGVSMAYAIPLACCGMFLAAQQALAELWQPHSIPSAAP